MELPALTGTLLGPVCFEDVLEGHYQVQKRKIGAKDSADESLT